MRENRKLRRLAIATGMGLAIGIALPVGLGMPAFAGNGHGNNGNDRGHGHDKGTSELRKAVSAKNITKHLKALQELADDNGSNRAAGSAGHVASAEYIEKKLRKAGYKPVRQAFSYDQFVENGSEFEQLSPNPTSYVDQTDYDVMDYSGAGDVDGVVTAVDINLDGDRANTSGCEAEDFTGFAAGSIALIQRGTCDFRTKVDNAAAAGAVGAIVFNQGNAEDRLGLVFGTLAAPQTAIPAVGTTFAIGENLAGTAGASVGIMVDATVQTIDTFNVLADTKGSADHKVVVGAHLDSVSEGPGINDNGTGSAAILETAIQLAKSGDKPRNQVRFAFWSGEEDGLVGSNYYVSQLSEKDIKKHQLNLNFDMVGSPNFVRFVYDGDGSAFGTVGPDGSDKIEATFEKYFKKQGLATEATAFDGRSDYFGFINAGIPAGGLFTGAEGTKSAEQAAIFGGTAGAPFDPCYHQACDTIDNVNSKVLEQMADAIAHSTQTFAETKSPLNGKSKGKHHGHGHGHGDGHKRGR